MSRTEDREKILRRATWRCEICYSGLNSGMSLHHRRPRKMGGSKLPWINNPENLLAVCGSGTTGCHGEIESHRENSYSTGRLLRMNMNPMTTPFMDLEGEWWYLMEFKKYSLTMPNP